MEQPDPTIRGDEQMPGRLCGPTLKAPATACSKERSWICRWMVRERPCLTLVRNLKGRIWPQRDTELILCASERLTVAASRPASFQDSSIKRQRRGRDIASDRFKPLGKTFPKTCRLSPDGPLTRVELQFDFAFGECLAGCHDTEPDQMGSSSIRDGRRAPHRPNGNFSAASGFWTAPSTP